MSSPGSNASTELPPVDQRVAGWEEGHELDDGKLVRVPPADQPRGECHVDLAALLRAHVAAEWSVALDMLTRTSVRDDVAPDASVFPRARHPETGGRQLEHLAFEIVSTQTLANAGRKAAKLAGRGVRRVFAIDLERASVLEWSSALQTWGILDAASRIEDPALAVPLPIEALVDAVIADSAVVQAFVARNHPVIEQLRLQAQVERAARSVIVVLRARGLEPDIAEHERIAGERDVARLERWLVAAVTCASVAELLGE